MGTNESLYVNGFVRHVLLVRAPEVKMPFDMVSKHVFLYLHVPDYMDQWRRQLDKWGRYIHTFVFCFEIDSILKEINCAEHEYTNMSPPLIELATPLVWIASICKGSFAA